MDEAKYNKQIGRIKRMVFKNDGEVYGFIEGNSSTNGKDYYFKPVKDEDLYLDRGDLVSFRPREYDDGKYSALNVMLLEKDTAFWNFLCSQNGESLYEKIKSSLGTRDLKKIWERIPVDQLLNHEWLSGLIAWIVGLRILVLYDVSDILVQQIALGVLYIL